MLSILLMKLRFMSSIKEKIIKGLFWRFAQNIGAQAINFVVSIVLARILAPEDYGVVALVTVFTNIALVFINTGFNTAIIQKKTVDKYDLNTMFYVSLFTSLVLYIILFLASPCIAVFYREPSLVALLRVGSLIVVIGAFNSIQQAIVIREMNFKKSFIASLCGIIAQGVVGITLALYGYGSWALVLSTLSNYLICCLLMWSIVKWRPSICFSLNSFKCMFGFSLNLLVNELLNSLFNNIRSIVIGKQYTKSDLAFFDRGNQLPTLVMTQVDGAINMVLFSSLAKYQDNWCEGIKVLRRAMKTSVYVCAILMSILFVAAKPLVVLLLTEKWIDSVVYVQLGSILCLFWPLSAQRHALNALGKSSISLKLSVIQKILVLLLLFLTYKISIKAMIVSNIYLSLVMLVASAYFYKKHLCYKYKYQVLDVVPSILLAIISGSLAYCIRFLELNTLCTLLLQILIAIFSYVLLSYVFRLSSFEYLLINIKSYINSRKNKYEMH